MGSDAAAVCRGVVIVVLLILGGVPILSIWINQCIVGAGDSLHVHADYVHLTTRPTDNVLFGWEFIFGKPADEISLKMWSGICAATHFPMDIQEGQKLAYGDTVSINTFFRMGFQFQLEEHDSLFEGANDYSEVVEVSEDKMNLIRLAFDNGIATSVELNYTVTVKGANIFQEHKWFGFLADNLCVSAIDFVFGPWTGKAFAKALLKSGDMAKLYNKLKLQYQSGTISKGSIFKAFLTYQMKEGAKQAVTKPTRQNMLDAASNWAMNQTSLDENINEMVTTLKERGVYAASGQEGLDLYREVNSELDKLSSLLGQVTDHLEFCLSEVLPPSRDARYDVKLTVTR